MKYAKKLNMAIKLLASSKRVGDTFSVLVAPYASFRRATRSVM